MFIFLSCDCDIFLNDRTIYICVANNIQKPWNRLQNTGWIFFFKKRLYENVNKAESGKKKKKREKRAENHLITCAEQIITLWHSKGVVCSSFLVLESTPLFRVRWSLLETFIISIFFLSRSFFFFLPTHFAILQSTILRYKL